MQEVNANFRRIIEPDIYPDEYVGLVLSEEELRALTRALLERLQWEPEGAVISALGQTLRLEVVPPLLSVTRSSARTVGPPNAQYSQAAVQAIGAVLQYGPLDPTHLRLEDEQLLREVFETLRYVASEGAETGLNPRGMAAQVLGDLTNYFGRLF